MPTVALRDVELMTTGTWAASTGRTTVTVDDLRDALRAHADQLVDRAPLKFGHESPLNDPVLGDGVPAYGWVIPTRVGPASSAKGGTAGAMSLYGDVIGIPAKLGELIRTAYRRRSVEVAWRVKTTAGGAYRMVLTGLALLGAVKPAVKGLADVAALYSAGPLEQAETTSYVELVDGIDSVVAVAMLSAAELAGAPAAQLEAMAAAAGARDTGEVPPLTPEPDHDDPHTPPPATTGAHTMPAPIDEARLRELLAREQDVDVDATIAGLRSSSEPPAEPGDPAPQPNPAPQPGDPAPQPAPQPGSPQPAPQPAPEQSAAAAGVVQLTAGQYEAMSADAAFAGQMRREQTLDRYADRYTPAERASFAEALERDEAGTTALLAKLSPKFSTTPRGADNAPNVDAGNAPDDAAWAAWEAQTFGAGLEDARRPAQ